MALGPGIAASSRVPLLLVAAAAAGCGSIPATEFVAYRDAFSQAREAGERVLLAHADVLDAAKKVAAEEAAPPPGPGDDLRLDLKAVSRRETAADPTAIRMRAWAVVASYNEALTRLVEGRGSEEVAAAMGEFVRDLDEFPFRDVGRSLSEAASKALDSVSPLAPLLRAAADAWWASTARKAFLQAVRTGSPLVVELLDLLEGDAQDFYDYRLGAHERRRGDDLESLARAVREAEAVLRAVAASGRSAGLSDEVRRTGEALAAIPEYASRPLKTGHVEGPATAADDVDVARIQTALERVREGVDAIQSSKERFRDYRELMTEYAVLLRAVRGTVEDLERAVEQESRRQPDVRDVRAGVVRIRALLEESRRGE